MIKGSGLSMEYGTSTKIRFILLIKKRMPKLPIEHGDSGEFARNKINESRNDLLKNVEEMKPHIENGYWWI